jgi:small subunit ribosomal protein S18
MTNAVDELQDKKKQYVKKKVCRFCHEDIKIDYKDMKLLVSFISEHGKILPRRMTGNCATHQRKLAKAIKLARIMALLPYGSPHI